MEQLELDLLITTYRVMTSNHYKYRSLSVKVPLQCPARVAVEEKGKGKRTRQRCILLRSNGIGYSISKHGKRVIKHLKCHVCFYHFSISIKVV